MRQGNRVKQELLMEARCECRHCGRRWVVTKEHPIQLDFSCCGSVHVQEIPGQLLLSDENGAWIRRWDPC